DSLVVEHTSNKDIVIFTSVPQFSIMDKKVPSLLFIGSFVSLFIFGISVSTTHWVEMNAILRTKRSLKMNLGLWDICGTLTDDDRMIRDLCSKVDNLPYENPEFLKQMNVTRALCILAIGASFISGCLSLAMFRTDKVNPIVPTCLMVVVCIFVISVGSIYASNMNSTTQLNKEERKHFQQLDYVFGYSYILCWISGLSSFGTAIIGFISLISSKPLNKHSFDVNFDFAVMPDDDALA
ncbi:MAG: hypothetical protein AAF514_04315, partial [Verrucomicrobiota bacterium]